jgi:hypothetical protein
MFNYYMVQIMFRMFRTTTNINNFFFANVFLHYPIIGVIKINIIFIIIACGKIVTKIKYILRQP